MALVVGTALCRNCSNIANVVTGTPGTQQCSHVHVEVLEVEQEELLQNDALIKKYGEELMRMRMSMTPKNVKRKKTTLMMILHDVYCAQHCVYIYFIHPLPSLQCQIPASLPVLYGN